MAESNVAGDPGIRHIGVKVINARPMNHLDYNKYRGWDLPADESGSDEGYLVEYADSGKANHPNHTGYISWSPRDVFDAAYRRCDAMTFGLAIEAMKKGLKVARAGWNGKDMFIFIREGRPISDVPADSPMGGPFISLGHICMKDANGMCVVGWLASQTDMLSEDWTIIE